MSTTLPLRIAQTDPFVVLASITMATLAGCNVVGPSSLSSGRSTYNTVINQTEDEQILSMIVRQRYDETFGLLAVASVTASIRAGATVGANAGFGPRSGYEGNLVPFSAGATYEESPTISYVPLRGEQFTERMLAPLSAEQAVMLSRMSITEIETLRFLFRRANGLTNPRFSSRSVGPEFDRCIDLFVALREAGSLDIVTAGGNTFELMLHNYAGGREKEAGQFLSTLEIHRSLSDGAPVLLPLRFLVGAPRDDGIELETPSALEIIASAGAGVEVPPDHLKSGIARAPAEFDSPASQFIVIRSSRERPPNAAVAVAHRGWWFYIDSSDTPSKQSFLFLRTLIGMRLDSPVTPSAPILTVPVRG